MLRHIPVLTSAPPSLDAATKTGHDHARIGVGVAVLTPTGYVLLERQGSHGAGQWSLPGGGLEKGERLIACAIRECDEEVGVTIQEPQLLPYLTEDFFPEDGQHWITLYVFGRTTDTPRIKEPTKATRIGTFWPNAFPRPLFAGIGDLARANLLPTSYA